MPTHDLSAPGATGWLTALARDALEQYDIEPDAELTLLNISENATYAVDEPGSGRRTVLRLHRHGYHDRDEIASELYWLEALREQAGVRTPHVLRDRAGRRLVSLPAADGSEPRHAVLFEWLPGTEPADATLVRSFEELGGVTARMHEHVTSWLRPAGFTRFAWDYGGAFGATARWGRWQHGIAVGPAEREILGRLDETLRARLARFGQAPDRYGLIHADLRLANLLVHGAETYVIDFDDCGWGWYLYDLGAALSFIEDDPRVPELVDAWTRGYRRIRALRAEDEAEVPTFVMMRRLLLVAWIGSHSGTELARAMGAAYTAVSCDLAEKYLTRFG